MKEAAPAHEGSGAHWSWREFLAVGVLAYLWFILVRQLSVEWSLKEQYTYGWFVPALCSLLAWRRWKIRPAPEPPRYPVLAIVVAALCALLVPPVRLLFEVAAELRVLNWLLAGSVVGITFCGVYLSGGRAWLGHFAFPIGFILVAVPWLLGLEEPLIQFLTRTVTLLTVESLNAAGISVSQAGNVIQTVNGPVGVDQACSGVRSFQGMVMISLFLGELLMLRWERRFALLIIGVAIAFLLNVVRAFFLSWNAVYSGLDSIDKWHDHAGLVIFWTSFLMVWALAEQMRPSGTATPVSTANGMTSIFPLPGRFVLLLAGFLAVTQLGIYLWYRLPERHGQLGWTVTLPPPDARDFQVAEIRDAVRYELQHDREITGSWTDDAGAKWSAFFFRWERGPVFSRIMARYHRPEGCLPASGVSLVADHGTRIVDCGELDLAFRAYEFDWNGQPLRVFFCAADDQIRDPADASRDWETGETSRMRKFVSIWRGERKMAQQTLQILTIGYATQGEADAAMRRILPGMIQVAN